jgi:hypothetical protein
MPVKEEEEAGRRRGREEEEVTARAVRDAGDGVAPLSSSRWRAAQHCFSATLL